MRTKPNFRTRVLSTGMALGISLAALPTSALLAQTPEGAVTADGFIVRNGQIYQLRNGQATPLGSDAVMRITPAGEITGFDGQRRRLNENTVLTLDGRVLPAPPGVVFSTPSTAGGGAQIEDRYAQQREQQRATSGENLSGLAPGVPGRQTPASNAAGQSAASASSAIPSTGETVRGNDRNRENMNSDTSGIVDPVTGLPYGNTVVPAVDGNQQNSSTTGQANSTNVPANSNNASNSNTNANRSSAPSAQGQRGTADPSNSNVNGAQNGTQAQTGAANGGGTSTNANQTSQSNMNGTTGTQQAQPQGTQTQQPQGFSRQGVGTNSGTSSGTGPQSRPNSTNATQGGNGPTDPVNSSNASGGSTGTTRSTGTGSSSSSGGSGSSSSSGGSSGGGSSGGSAGSGSGGGAGGGAR